MEIFNKNNRGLLFRKILFLLLMGVCVLPFVNTVQALLAGIFYSMVLNNPWSKLSSSLSKKLLQISVIGGSWSLDQEGGRMLSVPVATIHAV